MVRLIHCHGHDLSAGTMAAAQQRRLAGAASRAGRGPTDVEL